MLKKTLITALSVIMILSLAACAGPLAKIEKDEPTATEQTESETWAAEDVTLQSEENATAPDNTEQSEEASSFIITFPSETTTVRQTVTVPPTTVISTTSWFTTTRPTTTARPTTTRPAATGTTAVNYEGTTQIQSVSVNDSLKYGVTRTGTRNEIYAVNADGSVTKIGVASEDITYNRLSYSAGYSDLLPAAKENRNTYADLISEALRLTNKMRAEKGLAPLTLKDKLTEQACVRAEEVAWSGKHSHMRPGNKYYTTIFRENGFTSGTAGENIGWGYSKASEVCTAWRNSETHYENIINPQFKSIGIGVAADCDPAKKLCWVQHFYSE